MGTELILNGVLTYEADGMTREVTDFREVEDVTPFTAPDLAIKTAYKLYTSGDFTAYNYTVALNDASELRVTAEITYDEYGVT